LKSTIAGIVEEFEDLPRHTNSVSDLELFAGSCSGSAIQISDPEYNFRQKTSVADPEPDPDQ